VTTYQDLLDRQTATHDTALSENQPPKVIGWASYDSVPGDLSQRIGSWGGFIEQGDRWQDFVSESEEKKAPYYEALRREILRRDLKQGGDWHQNDAEGVPVFNDGTVAMFTFRGWGDLMAAIWAEQEHRDYSYMGFYMDSCIPDQ
jgi:hypothetical protein